MEIPAINLKVSLPSTSVSCWMWPVFIMWYNVSFVVRCSGTNPLQGKFLLVLEKPQGTSEMMFFCLEVEESRNITSKHLFKLLLRGTIRPLRVRVNPVSDGTRLDVCDDESEWDLFTNSFVKDQRRSGLFWGLSLCCWSTEGFTEKQVWWCL